MYVEAETGLDAGGDCVVKSFGGAEEIAFDAFFEEMVLGFQGAFFVKPVVFGVEQDCGGKKKILPFLGADSKGEMGCFEVLFFYGHGFSLDYDVFEGIGEGLQNLDGFFSDSQDDGQSIEYFVLYEGIAVAEFVFLVVVEQAVLGEHVANAASEEMGLVKI